MGLSDDLLRRVAARVASHAGLRPPGWVLAARLERRLAALELDQPERYAALIESDADARELELLVESLRVGETRFFRHVAHVKAVTDAVVPALLRRGPGPVKAWSAGCATGEEPYTLAILLARGLPSPAYKVSVLATDISREAIATARAGVYAAAALEHVPAELRRTSFVPEADGRFRVTPAIARLITFATRNLAGDDYPREMDLIWCRNVLIYFEPDARRRAILRLIESLAPGGFLFVGYAETLRDFHALEQVRTPDAVLYRKPTPSDRRATMRVRPGLVRPPVPSLVSASLAQPATAPAAQAPAAAPSPPAIVPDAGMTPDLDDLEPQEAVVELRGRYDDEARLARELVAVLSGSYRRVVIDLDGADYLGDAAAPVLRRACSAARAAGIEVVLIADRQGTRRWLTRSGAGDEGGG